MTNFLSCLYLSDISSSFHLLLKYVRLHSENPDFIPKSDSYPILSKPLFCKINLQYFKTRSNPNSSHPVLIPIQPNPFLKVSYKTSSL